MKYVDEYRDPDKARQLIAQIRSEVTRRWVLMEVCGGQTHSLLRHGIAVELGDDVELIHGPGCPVCVTPAEAIDFAQAIAMQPDTTLVSFGDMVRVPGNQSSLQLTQANGGSTATVYSPVDAVRLARDNPDRQFVFFAVGFETTVPATALAILQAKELGLRNFSMLSAHVRVQPAMEAILNSPHNRVQAFLAAGHVCTVAGFDSYREMALQYEVPIVVTGFEPLDLLEGILSCVQHLERGEYNVRNSYSRCVELEGNIQAQQMIDRVYEISDRPWRGIGPISGGGYALRPEFSQYDAEHRFSQLKKPMLPVVEPGRECRAGDVLSGRLRPNECPEFGTNCTPDLPLGAPMVSSEGACAAYFRFGQQRATVND